jgi:putative tryptophan/tyrosine transport system substrate-binding protein
MLIGRTNRRTFIAALGGAVAWPLVARGQQPSRTYRLGFLIPSGRKSPWVLAFLDELRLNGFIEGQNLTIIPGGFDVQVDLLAERAEAMVKAEPDAIVGGPEPQLRALQAKTGTIPLIGMTNDMVAEGLVKSLARPGGNTTGISMLSPELDGKRQDILMEAVPGARRIAALADSNVTPTHIQALQDTARLRGIELLVFAVAKPEDIAPAVDAAKASGAETLNFLASGLFFPVNRIDIERATAVRLPAIHHWPEAAEAGGLIGYGPRFNQVWRQRARMTIKILRGNKPADLPVEQPTNFELAINLQAAKGLGLTIPYSLLAHADEVIE